MISNFWIVLIGLVVAFIVAMIIEDSRDFITDGIAYVLSFEWFGDLWEFITGMFENLGEFSIGGLVFGISSAGLIFFLKKWMLEPFLISMGGIEKIFWATATYVSCFVVGYLIGKKMFDD